MSALTETCRLLTALLFLCAATAAGSAAPDPSAAPQARLAALAVLAGDYAITTELTEDGGVTWAADAPQDVRISFEHNGMVLQERPVALSGEGFHMWNLITFDQYRNVYRKAAIDDTWGIMDVYEGRLTDGMLVLTNVRSGTTFPTPDGEQFFRLRMEVKAAPRWMFVDASTDGGASWGPAFRVRYESR